MAIIIPMGLTSDRGEFNLGLVYRLLDPGSKLTLREPAPTVKHIHETVWFRISELWKDVALQRERNGLWLLKAPNVHKIRERKAAGGLD